MEPLRGTVYGSRQTRRPGPDNDQVVQLACGFRAQSKLVGDPLRFRITQHATGFEEESRQFAGRDTGSVQQCAGFRISTRLQPAIWNKVASEKVLDRMR